jgi:predicted nucleic acid-binding protein
MSSSYVLDAWSLLALLQGEEPAATRVRELLQAAQEQRAQLLVSMINLGEVFYCVGRLKGQQEAEEMLDLMRRLPLRVLSASDETVIAAARLKIGYTLSYADAFAVAAGQQWEAVVVTGDPELRALQGAVRIEMLRRHR